jgi:hypothetical protein
MNEPPHVPDSSHVKQAKERSSSIEGEFWSDRVVIIVTECSANFRKIKREPSMFVDNC